MRVGEVDLEIELNESEIAREIYSVLPIEASGSYWGGEIYFEIPVKTGCEDGADDVVEPGTVAYWPAGHCLCVFWGPTPASHGAECRAASAVNLVGTVTNPEALARLRARDVRIEAA
jgi:hypothetical protein